MEGLQCTHTEVQIEVGALPQPPPHAPQQGTHHMEASIGCRFSGCSSCCSTGRLNICAWGVSGGAPMMLGGCWSLQKHVEPISTARSRLHMCHWVLRGALKGDMCQWVLRGALKGNMCQWELEGGSERRL